MTPILNPIPATYDPFALSRASCRACRGSGRSRSGHKICRCVYRRLEIEEARCRDRWELLYLAAIRDPDHLPPHPVPTSWLGRLRY